MTTTNKSETMSDELHAYLVAHGSTPDPVISPCRARRRSIRASQRSSR